VSQALDIVRDGGRVVICGHYTDNGPVEIHPHWQVNRKHVEIRGCWGCDYSHFSRAVGLAAAFGDRVPWRAMIGGRYRLAEAGARWTPSNSALSTKAVIVPNA
jgi:L-iditol 2-dehydrogenase